MKVTEPTLVIRVTGTHENGDRWQVDHGDALPCKPDAKTGYQSHVEGYALFMRVPTTGEAYGYNDHWLAWNESLDHVVKIKSVVLHAQEFCKQLA